MGQLRRSFLVFRAPAGHLRRHPTLLCGDRTRQSGGSAGKVLARIQPHADDFALRRRHLAADRRGIYRLLTALSNDDMPGRHRRDTVLANERDNQQVPGASAEEEVFDLNYSNHQMDKESKLEIRAG